VGGDHPRLFGLIGSCASRLIVKHPNSPKARRQLGSQLAADGLGVKLVLSELTDSDAVEVYKRIDDTPLGVIANSWLVQNRPANAELAAMVNGQLVGGPGNGEELDSFLKAAKSLPFVARSLGSDQVHSAAQVLMAQVQAPINPYAPNPILEDCRSALVALLIERPEAQTDIEAAVSESSSSAPIPPLVDLAAAGISGRPPDWGRSLISLATAWTPSDSLGRCPEHC
jgi:hypothetical protein